MTKILIAKTRWEYYAANLLGLLTLIGLVAWFFMLSFSEGGLDITSIFLYLALILLIVLPFALISFFSSMKTIEVTSQELTISYVFQKHVNVVRFADIADLITGTTKGKKKSRPMRDTFKLTLKDGRAFEFERSQFKEYAQLKALCLKKVKGSL
jgi:hypothetical protein